MEIALDGFRKDDPPKSEKIMVEVDVPDWICMKGVENQATEHDWIISDWVII